MPRAARDVCTVTSPSCSVRGARRYVTLVERGRIVEPSNVTVDSFTCFFDRFLILQLVSQATPLQSLQGVSGTPASH